MFDQNSDPAPLSSLSILNKSGADSGFSFQLVALFSFKNQKAIFWSEDAWPRKYLK